MSSNVITTKWTHCSSEAPGLIAKSIQSKSRCASLTGNQFQHNKTWGNQLDFKTLNQGSQFIRPCIPAEATIHGWVIMMGWLYDVLVICKTMHLLCNTSMTPYLFFSYLLLLTSFLKFLGQPEGQGNDKTPLLEVK